MQKQTGLISNAYTTGLKFICFLVLKVFFKKIIILLQIIFLIFLYYFDVLI
jgi:hypothetical protein